MKRWKRGLWLAGLCALSVMGVTSTAVAQPSNGDRGWVKPAQGAERRVALVIGNSGYRDSPLRNPGNDARVMAKALREVGFDVIEKVDLDQKGMKIAIRDFGDRLGKAGGVGLFYYAGHAMQVNGHNYLIPVDARIEREADVDIESVLLDAVLDQMGNTDSRLNVVVLDACRNNPFARSFRSATQGLAFVNAPRGTLIAYATAPGSVAADGDGGNGTYTGALVKRLGTDGLEIGSVFRRVREDVLTSTDGRQVPWESSSLVGEFYFKPRTLEAPDPVSVAPPKVEPGVEPKAESPARPEPGPRAEGAPASADPKAAMRALFMEGQRKVAAGDLQGALRTMQAIVHDYPNEPGIDKITFNIGAIHEKLGDANSARMMYRKVVSTWPTGTASANARERLAALSAAPEAPAAPPPVKVTQVIERVTERVYFDHGKAVVKPVASPILDAVAAVLRDHPTLRLRVEGHTDSEGSDAANLKLSQSRAQAVTKILISKGISAERLEATGYGEARPLDTNRTAAGRASNNRVGFVVVSQ